ncbi:MAG TPA: hypothetical protein VFW75_01320 [Acetobacteraceae bacterium]|nr:hypothetical protein [Acetobacteraceae bacterium]
MRYQVHIEKREVGSFATSEEALAWVRRELKTRPDCEPEILDGETGQPFAPAASRGWRDQLAKTVGY